MNRRITLLVAALAVAGLIAMVPLGAAVTGGPGVSPATGDGAGTDGGIDEFAQAGSEGGTNASDGATADDLSPGERLSGVIGVQGAEVDGEVSSRSFEIRLADAETDEERAAVIAAQLERNGERLAELRERQRELRERREAGNVSSGAYAARQAAIGTRVATVNRTTNRSAEVAADLPEEALAERDVDADRIRTLRESASELSGPEVAAITREIGGNRTGAPMGPDRRGPPGSGIGAPDGSADRGPPDGLPGSGPSEADAPEGGENATGPRNGSIADPGGAENATAESDDAENAGDESNGDGSDVDGADDGGADTDEAEADGAGGNGGADAGSDEDDDAGTDEDADAGTDEDADAGTDDGEGAETDDGDAGGGSGSESGTDPESDTGDGASGGDGVSGSDRRGGP
ncbi:DUF7096 domain-containing protein [Halorubrum cibi]|uniref:DUF7096 domain-containing protein n=1 Tax=Halorubrum cibi TaxID=413815 RepID=A0A521DCI6_9EURY|nr:hypothetical protein [Halorubrum cibi]SMO69399.1 hypothetical protein SAMN06264867_106180 [Halorubrum cibi]